MKNVLILFCLAIIGSTTPLAAQEISDIQGVEKAVNYYLEGGTKGDAEMVAKAFHPQAELKFMTDDGYTELPIDQFLERIKPSPEGATRLTSIRYIQIAGGVASACVEILYPNRHFKFIDFFNLLKVEGEWKIVNKIFHREELGTKG